MTEVEAQNTETRQAWRRWLLRAASVLIGLGVLAGLLALYEPAEEPDAGAHAVAMMRAGLVLAGIGLALALVPLFIRRRTANPDRTT